MFGNIKKCSIEGCSNPIWGNNLCKNHKPRKPIAKKSSFLTKRLDKAKPKDENKSLKMKTFFMEIWNHRSHKSEVSGKFLGNEPRTTFFHHLLPKSKYPDIAFDEENIILLTWEEHQQVENDIYRYEEVNNRRKYLKLKYNL